MVGPTLIAMLFLVLFGLKFGGTGQHAGEFSIHVKCKLTLPGQLLNVFHASLQTLRIARLEDHLKQVLPATPLFSE